MSLVCASILVQMYHISAVYVLYVSKLNNWGFRLLV